MTSPWRIDARGSAWRPKPATFASRRRSPLTCRHLTGSPRANSRASAQVRGVRSPGENSAGSNRAVVTWRSTRSSARRAPTPPVCARPGRSSAIFCPKPTGSMATRGSPTMRRASSIRSLRRGIARRERLRCPRRRAPGGSVPRCGPVPGPTSWRRSRPCRRTRRRIRHGATGKRALSPPRAGGPKQRRSMPGWPARSASTACCRRRRSDSGRRPRARRSRPMSPRWRTSVATPPCAARSSSRNSTCGPSRSASGTTSCADSPTRLCSWPPSTPAARGCTIARSIPPSGRRPGTISGCAT